MKVKLKSKINEPFVSGLIKDRGIEDVNNFLNPKAFHLQDPFDLNNMEEAIELVERMNGKKTLLVIDSDVDGYCSSAIFYLYMKEIYPDWEIEYAIHTGKGHGLKDISEVVDIDNYEFIVLPDAGTNDDEDFLGNPDSQFLVLDHHLRTGDADFPTNVVVVNNQLSEKYENKSLSGAGVVWQFCRAFDIKHNLSHSKQFIDLVAIAIVSDVMDITTLENRYIITKGLKKMNNQFLKVLADKASFKTQGVITPMVVSFYIAPYINAMCRVGDRDKKERVWWAFVDPFKQVECFKRGVKKGTLIDVVLEAERETTNARNQQKRTQEKMVELSEKTIIENDLLKNKILVVILDETFNKIPPELNGVSAALLAEKKRRPTLIGRTNKDGFLRGSIRGLETIEMPPFKEFLLSSGFFEMVEGHSEAAGFSIHESKIDPFLEWANEELKDVDMSSDIWYVDFQFQPTDDALKRCISDMSKMKDLWGKGFPEPLINVEGIKTNRHDIQVMGKKGDTVKITQNGVAYLFFKRPQEEVKEILKHSPAEFNIVGTPNLNEYFNTITPQIFVKDYTIKGNLLDF